MPNVFYQSNLAELVLRVALTGANGVAFEEQVKSAVGDFDLRSDVLSRFSHIYCRLYVYYALPSGLNYTYLQNHKGNSTFSIFKVECES